MDLLFYFFLFLFGTFIGSFLGVLVDRLPHGETVLRGRSHCAFCHKTLGVLDLVPVVSYLFLRGKCRYCKKKLSLFYPVIEILTGLLFILPFAIFHLPFSIDLFFYLFILSSLIVLFFVDLKYGILPFPVVFPAILVTFFYLIITSPFSLLTSHFIAAFGAFVFFFLLFVITRGRGMGFGDVVYVILMGLLLGFPGILFGLYFAFVTGAIVSLILVGLKRKKIHGSTIAFGPFLIFGTIVMMFWGEELTDIAMRILIGY